VPIRRSILDDDFGKMKLAAIEDPGLVLKQRIAMLIR
jgi:hypothetical protein